MCHDLTPLPSAPDGLDNLPGRWGRGHIYKPDLSSQQPPIKALLWSRVFRWEVARLIWMMSQSCNGDVQHLHILNFKTLTQIPLYTYTPITNYANAVKTASAERRWIKKWQENIMVLKPEPNNVCSISNKSKYFKTKDAMSMPPTQWWMSNNVNNGLNMM